jgi:hypothetical protein
MIGLLLLTIKPAPAGIWRWCSGSAFVIFLPFVIMAVKSFRRFDSRQPQHARANLFVFYPFGILGTGSTLLKIYNIAILNAFWPFFTGIVAHLLADMSQFARIILSPPES